MKYFVVALLLIFAVLAIPSANAQTKHSVTLAWTQAAQTGITVSDFNVYRSTVSGSGYQKVGNVGNGTTLTYVDSTVVSNTIYFYVVTAISSTGQESAQSNEAKAVIPQDLSAPQGLTVTVK